MSTKYSVVVIIMIVCCAIYVETKPAFRDGNQNNAAVCTLPAIKGHCRALLIRWMYNSATGKCQEFGFGGCDGNGNNFVSYKACMAVCAGI